MIIDLNEASLGIRKYAYMKGIKSGKVDFYFTRGESDRDITVCRVYNRNHPIGFLITGRDIDIANQYTFNEIKRTF